MIKQNCQGFHNIYLILCSYFGNEFDISLVTQLRSIEDIMDK